MPSKNPRRTRRSNAQSAQDDSVPSPGSQIPTDEMLIAQFTYSDADLRRALEKDEVTKQNALHALRKQHEAMIAYATSPELDAEMRRMNDDWDGLPQSERDAIHQRAQNQAREYETERALLGEDWSAASSTDQMPPHVVRPVLKYLVHNARILQKLGKISQADIKDALDDKSIPMQAFRNVVLFMHGRDPLAIAIKSGNYDNVKEVETLAAEIVLAWEGIDTPKILRGVTSNDLEVLATIAAKVAFERQKRSFQPTSEGRIIDEVTGLVLPPEPRLPYRDRGYHPDGTRLSIFEHLSHEYGPYLKTHLLFSGHLQDIDRPAYEALLYLARKDARAKRLEDDVSNTAAFLLDHGILAGEHLEFPPEHLSRQVDIINKSRALSIVPKIRGRRTSKASNRDTDR